MTDQYFVSHGSHTLRADGMCAMEWVAYLAGEEHSDSPVCVDPVLRRFGMGLNDALPDSERQRLRPYLARMIGTAGDGLAQQRAFMLVDWAVRVVAPIGLEEAGWGEAAVRLRGLAAVVDADSAHDAVYAASDAAAADSAAACADSAAAAADSAAAAAAYAAAYADSAAAADYVAAAADAAVHAAVYVANGWEQLLPSVLDLLDRMLPAEPIQLPVVEGADQVCMLQPNQLEGVTIV